MERGNPQEALYTVVRATRLPVHVSFLSRFGWAVALGRETGEDNILPGKACGYCRTGGWFHLSLTFNNLPVPLPCGILQPWDEENFPNVLVASSTTTFRILSFTPSVRNTVD
jgi:hypothetical protein